MDTLIKLDTAVLQHQNQKLSQKLEAQKIEISALEKKYIEQRENREFYDSILGLVEELWDELVDELNARGSCLEDRLIGLKESMAFKDWIAQEDGSKPAGGDALVGEPNASSSSVDTAALGEDKETDNDKTIETISKAVASLDDLWPIRDKCFTAFLKSLSDDGSIPPDLSHDLQMKVENMIQAVNEIHMKHKTLVGALQSHKDADAKNEAEVKHLRRELEKTVADLEESNRKLSVLKAEKDATKGTFFPVLNVGNKHVAGDKVRDKQKYMQDMESTLKELLDQASFRLLELKHLHQERIEILKQLSSLQSMLKNVKYICSSHAYVLVKDQLEKTKTDLAQYESMYKKIQVEKDNLSWREKEMSLKNDVLDVLHRSSAVADSRINELEMEIQKHKRERNLIEMKLEEASREPGRKEIISEFKTLVSSFPEEMSRMQEQLSKHKEAAANVHSLRADVQSLSNILKQKDKELEKLHALSAIQETEMRKLQAKVKELEEYEMDLDLFMDMFRRESPFTREVLEAREAEYAAWATVQTLRTKLDEHNLENRVKTAIEAEAKSQQKLAAVEALIAEQRHKLEASKREEARLAEAVKAKQEESEAYLSEIETIGQAYEDMQNQNQQLLQQITERDDYNIKLVIEGIRARQQRDAILTENKNLEKEIQETSTTCNFYELKAARIEEQVRTCSEQVKRIAEERAHNRATVESNKKRLIEVKKSSQQYREAVEEVQSEVDKNRADVAEIQIEIEKERFERKRAEEDVEALKRKVARTRSQVEGLSVIEKQQQKLRELKEILNCGICHDRRKEVVIAKCYHLFCNPCITKVIESRHRKCPVCTASFGANDVKPVYI